MCARVHACLRACVCVCVYNPELWRQLKAALETMELINAASCPFLNQIYDSYFADDNCYLVVEYCANGPLDSAIKNRGSMPEPCLSFVVRSVFLCLNTTSIVWYCIAT